ncbi:DNA cytosine methyltransferase [Candidatus Woesearchaeota archaeon]|nr:DNA cytosine methyltransferase [Candidatus Woesearchaeota archaeon]
MNILELFSGSGTISREFERAGHKVFSIDIRKRANVCVPSLKKDIMQLSLDDLPFWDIDVLWASPPCEIWSYAAGSFHWNGNIPQTEKAQKHIQVIKKTLALIEKLQPKLWFIENPRGKLRYFIPMTDFLMRNAGIIKLITYSSYGFPTVKPTTIFTNAYDWQPKRPDGYGRGAKVQHRLDFITKSKKQKVPGALAQEIREYCEKKLEVVLCH